jgi:flagellar biosynthetic protein FliR
MQGESFPGVDLQFLVDWLLLLFVSSLRVGSFLVASPFFGSRMVPLPVRIVFSIALGIGASGFIDLPITEAMLSRNLLPLIFQEILLGLTCGLILTLCFSTVTLAGEKIAATSGLAFASQVDPNSGSQSPVISQIFSLFLLVIFFSVNGHLIIALRIALPIVSLLFFVNLGIGFITKSAPQLNLFSFGFPLTILGTFFALYFSVDALQFTFRELITKALGLVEVILLGGANG